MSENKDDSIDDLLKNYLEASRERREDLRDSRPYKASVNDVAIFQIGLMSAITSLADAISELDGINMASMTALRKAINTMRLLGDIVNMNSTEGLEGEYS